MEPGQQQPQLHIHHGAREKRKTALHKTGSVKLAHKHSGQVWGCFKPVHVSPQATGILWVVKLSLVDGQMESLSEAVADDSRLRAWPGLPMSKACLDFPSL